MYGDQSGSPGRDSRQHDASPPLTEDVKVAGAPITGPGEYHADDQGHTTALSPLRAEQRPYEPQPYQQNAHELTAFEQTAVDQDVPYQEGPYYGGPPEGPPGGPPPDEFDGMRRPPRRSVPPKVMKIAAVAAAVAVVGGVSAGAWAVTSSGSKKPTAGEGTQAQAQVPAPAPLTDAQRREAAAERRKELKKRAARAAREDDARPRLLAKGKPPATKKPSDPESSASVPSGSPKQIAQGMLSSYGWSQSQFGCLDRLWMKESGWNVHAANPSSGAYGIPQALPGSKMASAGSDWRNNPRTQIKWGLGYIKSRYGSPCGAWGHSQSSGWY